MIVLVAVFSLPYCVSAANFSDVPEAHKNFAAIQALKDANLISGYKDGTFKPDQPVNRAESAAIILKAAGITATKTTEKIPFTDVPEDAWFFPTIQKGVNMGKLKGYEDKTFRPANPVTLPEAVTLALAFFQVSTKNIEVDHVIYDGLDTKEWYSKPLQYAKNQNLILPDEKGHVDPAKSLTRGELAEIIYRMRTVQQTGKPIDITSGWITTESQYNFWKLKHPANWEIFKGQKNSVIWKRVGTQAFFTRMFPKSARVSISVVENPESLTSSQILDKLKADYAENYPKIKPAYSELTISTRGALKVVIPERRTIDLYIYLPNRSYLAVYAEYGEAPIGEFLKKQLEEVLASYQYVEAPPIPPLAPLEERLSTLRENILISDKWKEIAPLFPDKKIIQTDAIGIGTGPVDYYFSKEANFTIKLERNSGTVLNIKEGSTDAF